MIKSGFPRPTGFSLVEITVVVALVSILALLVGTVWIGALNVWEVQETEAQVNESLRQATSLIADELRQASLEAVPSVTPAVAGLVVGSARDSVTFQRPLDAAGETWSSPVTIQWYSEDVNGNLLLDGDEDSNGNGALDRVIERRQDLNGDGEIAGPGEVQILARNVDQFVVTLEGRTLELELLARAQSPRKRHILQNSQRHTVRLMN